MCGGFESEEVFFPCYCGWLGIRGELKVNFCSYCPDWVESSRVYVQLFLRGHNSKVGIMDDFYFLYAIVSMQALELDCIPHRFSMKFWRRSSQGWDEKMGHVMSP